MNIQGLTSEFSLPELFKFLQESQQTGRLSFKPATLSGNKNQIEEASYYFWFAKGNLIAASNRLDGLGLLHILQARSLIQSVTLPRLLRQCPPRVALGQFLRDRALLTNKQLKSLFASQVLTHVGTLLKMPNAKFAFHESYPRPYLEMTGVRVRATDVTLPSLRVLKDWDALMDKLPSLDSGLKPTSSSALTYQLQPQEEEVLRLSQKGLPLIKISKALKLPVLDVQKTGFRLIFVGLVKEVPLMHMPKPAAPPKRKLSKISETFLGRLSGYLKRVPARAQPTALTAATVPVVASVAINPDKTARNSAVQRIKTVIGSDRAERLPDRIANSSPVQYPSCLLTGSMRSAAR